MPMVCADCIKGVPPFGLPKIQFHNRPRLTSCRRATSAKHAPYEAMAMIRKGQVQNIGGHNMRAQAAFIAELFDVLS
jgi:hypothetical protein